MFRVIVAGSRQFSDYELLKRELDRLLINKISEGIQVVCGEARGADSLGKQYAIEKGYSVASYPADWNRYGKAAGYYRNQQMADNADALVAFWDGISSGTENMIQIARQKRIPVRIVRYKEKK